MNDHDHAVPRLQAEVARLQQALADMTANYGRARRDADYRMQRFAAMKLELRKALRDHATVVARLRKYEGEG